MIIQRFYNRAPQSMNPTNTNALKLTASVARLFPLVADIEKIFITGKEEFLVKFGTASVVATIPAGDVLDGDAPFYCPGLIDIPAGITHISIISPNDGIVYISSWKKGGA